MQNKILYQLKSVVLIITDDINFLSSSTHWFADGTFRVTPEGFDQLYTIHALKNGSYSYIYALLPGRAEQIYRRLLHHIGNLSPSGAPQSVVTDFELAAINALRVTFPNAEMTGCYFHFGQNIWRRLQTDGKATLYTES